MILNRYQAYGRGNILPGPCRVARDVSDGKRHGPAFMIHAITW
jgi:hypothetical protein